MRLARLDLAHYGKFTDYPLTFSLGEGCDLQFIVGPNEAGKSTVRKAILDLFYGIDKSSPYGYRGLAEMEIGAVVEADGSAFAFRRRKARSLKDSLTTPDGTRVELAVLARIMGNAEQAFYLRMFGLNHPELVNGAKELLSSSGDVGQMLFQAAAGVNGLHKLRAQLEKQASELWTKKTNMGCAYYVAQKQFAEAQTMLKQATVTSALWQKQRRELDLADSTLAAAQKRYAAAEREHLRLERVRRVKPYLRELDEASELLVSLGSPPLLPVDAEMTIDLSRNALADAEGRIKLLTERLAGEVESAKLICVNTAALDRKGEIDSLAGRVQTYVDAVRDRPDLSVQRERNIGRARQLAAQLGWPEREIADIAGRVLPKVNRSSLIAFAQLRGPLTQAVTRAEEKLDTQNELIEALKDRISGAGTHVRQPVLSSAATAATALNLAVRGPAAKTKQASARARFDTAFANLAPWTGDAAALRDLALPDVFELQGFTDRRAELHSKRTQLKGTREAKVIEIAKARAALGTFSQQHQIVTLETLGGSRASRDELWRKLRDGANVAEVGDQYEARVAAADGVADRRYEGAVKIEQLATLQTAYDTLVAEVDAHDDHVKAVERDIATLQSEWDDRMKGLGLLLSQSQFAAWLPLRTEALAAEDALALADAEIKSLNDEMTEATAALRKALIDAGEVPPDGAELAVLSAMAEATLKAVAEAETRVKDWNEQHRTVRSALPALQRKKDESALALDEWTTAWKSKLVSAGLTDALSPEAASISVETLAEIEAVCEDVQDNTGPRIAQMDREIETFTSRARTLAASCAPEAEHQEPEEIVALMRDLLRDAESQSKRREAAETAMKQTRAALDTAREDKVKAEATLAPLYELASVEGVAALAEAVAAATRYRAVENRITKSESAARNAGDGLPLADLVAEAEKTEFDHIEDHVLAAQLEREDAKAAHEQAIRLHTHAKADFEKFAGQDDAARAESMRRNALLGMSDAVEEYISMTVGARLVKWAVDRYSEEKQEPLLKRASALFASLTDCRFTTLNVNFDVEPPELVALRTDGTTVSINGLSTGTEDQLYLAMRLAALELHLEVATPLPLILDDIFINWSDERTAAAFNVLAELSKRTQIIVLSHHEHLIEVAKNAVGTRVNVLTLNA